MWPYVDPESLKLQVYMTKVPDKGEINIYEDDGEGKETYVISDFAWEEN